MDNVELLRIAALLPMDPRNRELLKSSANEIERLREEVKANKDSDYHEGRCDGEEIGYRMGYDDGYKDGLKESK